MALTPAKLRDLQNKVEVSLDAAREAALKARPAKWDRIARKNTPGVGTVSYAGMDDVPEIGRVGAVGYTFAELSSKVYTLTSERYGNGLKIKVDDYNDDASLGIYAKKIALLGTRIEQFADRAIYRFLENGHNSTLDDRNIEWLDGEPLFSASHKVNNSKASLGTYSNLHTSRALSATNFETTYAEFMVVPDGEGVQLGIEPNRLIVPPQLAKTAYDIVQAINISTGGTNVQSNASRAERGQQAIEVVVSAYLSGSPTAWYLAYSDGGILSPLLWQETEPLVVIPRLDATSENVYRRDEYEWLVKGRSQFGINEPRLIHRSVA